MIYIYIYVLRKRQIITFTRIECTASLFRAAAVFLFYFHVSLITLESCRAFVRNVKVINEKFDIFHIMTDARVSTNMRVPASHHA